MIISALKAAEAASILGVELTGLTSDQVRGAYRNKAKECHPDHHGSDKLDVWARVSWAKECLEHWLKHHPPEETRPETTLEDGDCRACEGTGRVNVRKRGFGAALTMVCVICRGVGSVIPEENDSD